MAGKHNSELRPQRRTTHALIPLDGDPEGIKRFIEANQAKAAAEVVRTPIPFERGSEVVLAFQWSEADAVQAVRVLEWWRDIRATAYAETDVRGRPHIVTFRPKRTAQWLKDRVDGLLETVGQGLEVIEPAFDLPDERYPRGSVWGFWHIAQFCHERKYDFVLMEPDAIPLKATWWTELETEVETRQWPYLGHLEPAHVSGGYPKHMAGCGAYWHQVWPAIDTSRLDKAFDVALAEHVVPLSESSRCIQQVFGHEGPPRFRTQEDVRRIIREDAVLFHRNKDGSLIQLLRERL